MRRGFLLSEYLVGIIVLMSFACLAPNISNQLNKLQWHRFEQQVRFLQHHARQQEQLYQQASKLWVRGNQIGVNHLYPVEMPIGWYAKTSHVLKISRRASQAGTVYLTNGVQTKRLVFQVGGGTFDLQE